MKISYSPYELKSPRFKKRDGALLRIEFAPDYVGYADCHPWSSLGDLPLADQIALLLVGCTTPLTAKSIYFARLDADARIRKINLFDDLKIPTSHFLLQSFDPLEVSTAFEEGFKKFKIKASYPDLNAFKALLPIVETLKCQLRVDFNNSLSCTQYLDWLKCLEGKEHLIDFFEDPYLFETDREIKKTVPLAADFNPCTFLTDIRVIKPAVQCVTRDEDKKIVVTSYLDHPFGQLTAAYTAAKIQKSNPSLLKTCGLLSHRVYEKNAFSEQLSQKGPAFTLPQGTGFGFDELLQLQDWKS